MAMTIATALAEASIKENLEQFLIVLCVSLSVATISRIFSWFREIPYTLLLVIVGLGLAFVDIRLVNLSPELILEIFLPPLLFEAAWNLNWRNLKENWLPIILFAVVGVIVSVVGIAFPLSWLTDLSIATALLVGASLSATDPVSVVALFRELGASKKLTILMEGESLFNDGVAVVAFVLLVGIPLGLEQFSLTVTIVKFFTVVGIGVGMGCAVGFGISLLTQKFDLPLVEQSLTLVSAYGTYLLAEELGGSGVIGVVTVGIILGNYGSRIGMNPRTRLLVSEFWEFLAFFVNSIVFLLIGDQIQFSSLISNFYLIMIAIAAVLVTRICAILLLANFSNFAANSDINWKEQIILWWGGLRGSVSIAIALSVPTMLGDRQEIIDIVFGVVLFTLLVEGLSTKWLLNKLDLIGDQSQKREYAELLAQRLAFRRVKAYLDQMAKLPDVDEDFYELERTLVTQELGSVTAKLATIEQETPQLKDISREQLRAKLLDIEADTYAELIRSGRLDSNLSSVIQDILVRSIEDEPYSLRRRGESEQA